MIITQVYLVLRKVNDRSKKCSFVTQHYATDVSFLRERAIGIGMLTAGMSTTPPEWRSGLRHIAVLAVPLEVLV
jgi:hypothetical protein